MGSNPLVTAVSITAVALVDGYRDHKKLQGDPTKALRSTRRAPYRSAGMVLFTVVARELMLAKGDDDARKAAEKIRISTSVNGFILTTLTSFTALKLAGGTSPLSSRQAAKYVAVTHVPSIAYTLYNLHRRTQEAKKAETPATTAAVIESAPLGA